MSCLVKYGTKGRFIYFPALVFSLAVFLIGLAGPPAALGAEQAVIKEAVVNLRSAPDAGSSNIVGKAMQGESLLVLGSHGDWYRVVKGDLQCWVAGWLVDLKPSTGTVDAAPPGGGIASYRAEITENNVNIRSGPGTTYGVIGQASAGRSYNYLEKTGEWYKISTGSGQGWVYGKYVKLVDGGTSRGATGSSGWAVVNGNDINIRSGPGTTYQVVSRANLGERYMLADKSSDWYKIILDNGSPGWIAAWLVKLDGSPSGSAPAGGSSSAGATPAGANSSGANQGGVLPPAPANTGSTGSSGNPAGTGNTGGSTVNNKPAVALKSVASRLEGGNTVIIVQSQEKLGYTVSSLESPDRLIIDIKGQRPGTVPESINPSSPLVGSIRVGWYGRDPDVTRLVVDLKKPARYEKILSADARQLQIILKPREIRSLAGAKIVLDPGHGGSDPGAIGPSGLKEKDVNLDIAKKAADYLKKQGATVILTRTGDTYVDLAERPYIASKNGASLFVSIHSNANPIRNVNGSSTYYLRTSGESTDQTKFEGMYLARNLQSSLLKSLKRPDKGVLQADFAVLTRSKVPAALAEVAFISNPEEEKMLADAAFRSRVGQAIAQGIADYLAAK